MEKLPKLTGLFLGAGASYEAGMPLVWDLTASLKKWLTPEKLRSFNESWRSQGGGYPDAVIDDFVGVLSRSDLHYENMLGYLETQYMRSSPSSEEYHHLYTWLMQMVYFILYHRHINYADYIRRNLKYYDGLSAFADGNRPLWIFSLNHDLIIECLAATMDDMPLSSGFTSEVVCLPRRNQRRTVTSHLRAEVLPGSDLEQSAMPFFQHGTRGINLLKLHGALDIFTFRDGKDLLKVLPIENSVDGVLDALRAANEELNYSPENPVMATNEIVYADEMGEMQFLRRSLLAGAYKFNPRSSQVLPRPLLKHFQSYVNYLQALVCIGYGFGDSHINQVMREWLEFSVDRRLVIVRPDATSIPEGFLHVAPQVELQPSTATDYLDSFAGIVRSKREVNEKRLAAWMRRCGDTAESEIQMILRDHMRRRVDSLVERLKMLPIRDGDLDTDALGVSVDELIKDVKKRSLALYDADFEAFLASRDV